MADCNDVANLTRHFAHLGRGSRIEVQPEFDGLSWYQSYTERTANDGGAGWLVSLYDFADSWASWEQHPNGAEMVVCLNGRMRLIQVDIDGPERQLTLNPGEYAVNPPGCWHTADIIEGPVRALFITAGEGTMHKAR